MYDVTDFLFIEIWRFYTDRLAELVEIVEHHRAVHNQRVVLKLYPADMDPKQTSWPALTLARVLGACMTGGGSLMVAGEPDETTGTMHGLNSLFYPDHTPMRPDSAELLKRYYRQDALLYGLTHGPRVYNAPLDVTLPGCIVRSALNPDRNTLALRILHLGEDPRWSSAVPFQTALAEVPMEVPMPEGLDIRDIWYVTPDHPHFHAPQSIPFRLENGTLRFDLPHLHVHGTVLIRLSPSTPTLP
jgi:hypothetical protein